VTGIKRKKRFYICRTVVSGRPSKSMKNDRIWPSADPKPLIPQTIVTKFEACDYVVDIFFQKVWPQSAQGFPIYAKYTPKTFECLLHFSLSSSERPQTKSFDGFSRFKYVIWRGSAQGSAFWRLDKLKNLNSTQLLKTSQKIGKLQWRHGEMFPYTCYTYTVHTSFNDPLTAHWYHRHFGTLLLLKTRIVKEIG